MDSIDDLDTFLALAQTGHMGTAAQSLNLTQPALSARLRKLEAKLGMRLFERQASGMRLSSAGADLVEQAKHARANLRRLRERTQSMHRGEETSLRVGMTLIAGISRIPLLLRTLEERMPGLRLVLHEAFSSPLEQLVAEDELDLAFVHPPMTREDLTTKTLYTEAMVLSVPANVTIPPDTAQRRDWLRAQRMYWVGPQLGPDLHRRVSAWMARMGVQRAASAEVSSYLLAQSFVAAGAGVALVPTCVAKLHAGQVRTLDMGGACPMLPFAIIRRRRTASEVYDVICRSMTDTPVLP